MRIGESRSREVIPFSVSGAEARRRQERKPRGVFVMSSRRVRSGAVVRSNCGTRKLGAEKVRKQSKPGRSPQVAEMPHV